MIFSLWTDNGAMNSKPVFSAFEKSLKDAGCSVVHNLDVSCSNLECAMAWKNGTKQKSMGRFSE